MLSSLAIRLVRAGAGVCDQNAASVYFFVLGMPFFVGGTFEYGIDPTHNHIALVFTGQNGHKYLLEPTRDGGVIVDLASSATVFVARPRAVPEQFVVQPNGATYIVTSDDAGGIDPFHWSPPRLSNYDGATAVQLASPWQNNRLDLGHLTLTRLTTYIKAQFVTPKKVNETALRDAFSKEFFNAENRFLTEGLLGGRRDTELAIQIARQQLVYAFFHHQQAPQAFIAPQTLPATLFGVFAKPTGCSVPQWRTLIRRRSRRNALLYHPKRRHSVFNIVRR